MATATYAPSAIPSTALATRPSARRYDMGKIARIATHAERIANARDELLWRVRDAMYRAGIAGQSDRAKRLDDLVPTLAEISRMARARANALWNLYDASCIRLACGAGDSGWYEGAINAAELGDELGDMAQD